MENKKVKKGFNIEIGDVVIKDVATKIGSLLGEKAKEAGKIIDEKTKDTTFKL